MRNVPEERGAACSDAATFAASQGGQPSWDAGAARRRQGGRKPPAEHRAERFLSERGFGPEPEARGAKGGQVLIEVLLILPVFMLLIFMIMQIGFFSFQAIVTHHGAYEVARVASLSATKSSPCWKVDQDVVTKTAQMMFNEGLKLPVEAVEEPTMADPQEGGMHCDVKVTMERKIKIHLPMIGRFMKAASPSSCDADGCRIVAVVRMPIERPLEK